MDVSQVAHKSNGSVLVFDSGLGGLSVVGAIRSLAPDLCVDYAVDTDFFPYGDKSDTVLQARLPVLVRSLVCAARPDVFVIACNTASTLALELVRATVDIPVIGTVPAIKPAAAQSETGVIGLLATPATIRRAYTEQLIETFAQKTQVITHGSVELVRLAERHIAGDHVALNAFCAELDPLFKAPRGADIDVIVLACTHFPLIRDQLITTAPQPVTFIDSGMAIAKQTLRVLPLKKTDPLNRPIGQVWLTGKARTNCRVIDICRQFGFGRVGRFALLSPHT